MGKPITFFFTENGTDPGNFGELCFTKSDDDPTSFTPVGSLADSPKPILSPSPATDHDAEMLEV
jgi:hypothetical protein